MKRIVIIGSSGSGKTTLGRHLAKNLGYPVTDLDNLCWLPNWILRPKEEFASLIQDATSTETWIICGNQSKYRHLIWPKADTIICLDLPLPILLWRVICRTIHNIRHQTPLCNGNYESLRLFFSSKSILVWLCTSYFRHRRSWKTLRQTTTHVKWIHIRWPRKFHFLESYF